MFSKAIPFFDGKFDPMPPQQATKYVSDRFQVLMKTLGTMVSFPNSWEQLQVFESVKSEAAAFVMLDELADFIVVREGDLLITNKSDGVYARWNKADSVWVREK